MVSSAKEPFYERSLLDWTRQLAQRPPGSDLTGDDIWALCRSAMYLSLLPVPLLADDWRVCFAKTLAHALCGEPDMAREALSAFLAQPEADTHKPRLAMLLAAYLPSEALQLVDGRADVDPVMFTGLLLRNHLREKAERFLHSVPDDVARKWPELFLLRANVFGVSPESKLQGLNRYLQHYGLAPVSLLDANKAPSPTNVAVAQPVDPVRGPLVSILMTTYDAASRVSVAVASILAQSWRDIELIVVDDASNDDTYAVLESWAQRDPRVRPVRLPRNVGTYAAKMIGLKYAKGEFITCHDSDDWSHPEKIALQMRELLKDDGLVAIDSYWLRMEADGNFYSRWVFKIVEWNPSSFLFRRGPVLERAGGWDPTWRLGSDNEFCTRLHVIFGDKAIKRFYMPLSLSSHHADSLVNEESVGDMSRTGAPISHRAHWEAFMGWHIKLLAEGKLPFISSDVAVGITQRLYEAEGFQRVSAADVMACLQGLGLGGGE